MKTILLILIVSVFTCAHAQTNHFDSLTVGSRTFTNCTLSVLNMKEGIVRFEGGGARIQLKDLPDYLRSQYYDESSAEEYEKKTKAEAIARQKYFKEKAERDFIATRTAIIEKYHPLRVIDGALYDFSQLNAATDEDTLYFRNAESLNDRFGAFVVSGKIIQVLDEGLLVHQKTLDQAVLLRHYPGQSSSVDGTTIGVYALPTGNYKYETVRGSEKTVYSFDYGRVYDPSSDVFTKKTIITFPERQFEVTAVLETDKLGAPPPRHIKATETETAKSKATESSQPIASGTGFFITEDGYLITNNHVVEDATAVKIVTASGTIPAKVIKTDKANDLAILKAEGKFSPLAIVASRAVRLGSSVATIGFPNIDLQGFAPKFSRGEIAALSGIHDDAKYFQISVPVQPGNSGGALVDSHGNVVGIVSARLARAAAIATSGTAPENVNYAIKSSFLLSFLESIPAIADKLKQPNEKEVKIEDVVKSEEKAAILVMIY